jgi:lipoprotein-anchoring transpeptidase ErfK/SrfK
MKRGSLSRRQFVQLSGLTMLSVAFRPRTPLSSIDPIALGRTAYTWIQVYKEPAYRSDPVGRLLRDELVEIYETISADAGPVHNPRWHKLSYGYVHSGGLQIVKWNPQVPQEHIQETGALAEVAVPYTRTHRQADPNADPLYRLYYQSTTWIEESLIGADGRHWYQLLDDLNGMRYYARAEHLRLIPASEITPLSPEVPASQKSIEVVLAEQEVRAYEFGRLVFRTRISSGIPDSRPRSNGIPTITPSGRFNVSQKMPHRHMGNGYATSDLEAYELPGVPWVAFFHITGVAFHGTYWHNDFGRPRSHGCINMRTDEARWLYRWCLPVIEPQVQHQAGYGTRVLVL